MIVTVYEDANLNGEMDANEISIPSAAIYLDENRDGQYTAFLEPSFEGSYPRTIQLREPSVSIGVIPSSMGNLVFGRTVQPGLTHFTASLSSNTVAHIQIPLSINVAPVAEDIIVNAFIGDSVTIVIINQNTDLNNNIDVEAAIRIVKQPDSGSLDMSSGAIYYYPSRAKTTYNFDISIRYQVCDTAGLCSSEAGIIISYVPKLISPSPAAVVNPSPSPSTRPSSNPPVNPPQDIPEASNCPSALIPVILTVLLLSILI